MAAILTAIFEIMSYLYMRKKILMYIDLNEIDN